MGRWVVDSDKLAGVEVVPVQDPSIHQDGDAHAVGDFNIQVEGHNNEALSLQWPGWPAT